MNQLIAASLLILATAIMLGYLLNYLLNKSDSCDIVQEHKLFVGETAVDTALDTTLGILPHREMDDASDHVQTKDIIWNQAKQHLMTRHSSRTLSLSPVPEVPEESPASYVASYGVTVTSHNNIDEDTKIIYFPIPIGSQVPLAEKVMSI